MLAWLALTGCLGPSNPAPPNPPEGGSASWYVLELGGRPVGVEERREQREDGARVVWRRQRFLFELGGRTVPRTTTTFAELDGGGRVQRYVRASDEDVRVWEGDGRPVWLLELDRPVSGSVLALDPVTATVETVALDAAGWSQGGVDWTIADGQPQPEPLRLRPVAHAVEPEPVDPVALVVRPAPPLPDARSVRRARFEVDGEAREVRVPLPLELSAAERGLLAEMVEEVRRRVSYRPTPGRPDGLAALARGAGDCNERAAAFVALAGDRGLEARVVEGVVWQERSGAPSLVPHAWAEVVLGDRRVPVDPTLGQVVADATHLPLTVSEVLSAKITLVEGR